MVKPMPGGGFRACITDFGISRPIASPEPRPPQRVRSLSPSSRHPEEIDATASTLIEPAQANVVTLPSPGSVQAGGNNPGGAADNAAVHSHGTTTSLRHVSPPLAFTPRAGPSTEELIARQFAAEIGDDDSDDGEPLTAETGGPAVNAPVRPEASASSLTEFGLLIGTPFYLAPELAKGVEANVAVDIFSFGIIAHELLVGSLPFGESVALATMHGREVAPATSLLVLRPDLEAAVAMLLDRCLSFSPGDRPAAQELASVLRGAATAAGAQTPPTLSPDGRRATARNDPIADHER